MGGRRFSAVAIMTSWVTLSCLVGSCGASGDPEAVRSTAVPPSTAPGSTGASPDPVPEPPEARTEASSASSSGTAAHEASSGPAITATDSPAHEKRQPPGCGETAGHLRHFTFNSEVMRVVHPVEGYFVYTPACYDQDPTRRYPTIWLLHGAQHTESHWVELGVADAADGLIASAEIPPVILVLADGIYAQGDY